jgi:hypothetical protein
MVGGPYPCISPPEIPPLPVVNEMLQNPGGAGMNGGRRWDGFTITVPEYEQLVIELVAFHGFERSLVPEWVQTRHDWHAWIMERRWGVPADRHRELQDRARRLAEEYEQARASSASREEVADLFLQAGRAKDEADQFASAWVAAPGYRKYRRVMRWMGDAGRRAKAAEIAGDTEEARVAREESKSLRSRCFPSRSDDAWPVEWEDWPDYPPEEPKVESSGAQ